MERVNMREIGGYIELEKFYLPMLHENAVALNCGRNCLAYLFQTKQISKIALPYFLCDSVKDICKKYDIKISYYSVDEGFRPKKISLDEDEWLYLVNYYGQLDKELVRYYKNLYGRVILDNAQAYFTQALSDVDTIYTCRKFFGVADGAFLYTDKRYDQPIESDFSYDRMHFLLGRYEKTANEFYGEYVENNKMFINEPIKRMSKLTNNFLHAIDYGLVKKVRTKNYEYLCEMLEQYNRLDIKKVEGPFAYPLWVKNGSYIRKRLREKRIYIPMLWPNVLQDVSKDCLEYDLAENILPIPVDQRYTVDDMEYICKQICDILKEC